jgi:hypothetical protein
MHIWHRWLETDVSTELNADAGSTEARDAEFARTVAPLLTLVEVNCLAATRTPSIDLPAALVR